jgi:2-succinyl-5-enolpyruvyl-6-hydroxy-3-cyclohexene-1-carboxylate synthase
MSASVDAAGRIVADLVAAGVRDVVLSPGSRSAPIAYVVAAAERDGRLRLHVRHDERSAAFLGLGIGRADPEHPAVVVTTSGSAVANLVPAAMEAHHGGVPLVLLTADRPVRLRGTWANQTSESQGKLLASIAYCVDVDPVTCDGTPWLDALAAAKGGTDRRPGPAHLNVCFDVPLQPGPDERVTLPPSASASARTRTDTAELAAAELALGPRTVVVAGDGAGPEASALAAAARWPLLAEPTSGARVGAARVDAYRLILPALADRVERVVVYGRPTLSRPVTSLLDDPRVQVIQVVRHPDDLGPGRDAVRVGAVTVAGSDDPSWLYEWAEAGFTRAMDAMAAIDAWPVVTGLHVAQAIASATRPDGVLFVGSSNAVRDLDLVATELPAEALIVANRGLAGIDGAISTAEGVALASGLPTRAYLGDLTFLHDLNGLAIPAIERDRMRLQIVVANDDGGGIFATLEHANHPEAFERVFGTPVGADLASLCAGYGVRYRKVQLADLPDALAVITRGVTVLEVATSRANLARLHAIL